MAQRVGVRGGHLRWRGSHEGCRSTNTRSGHPARWREHSRSLPRPRRTTRPRRAPRPQERTRAKSASRASESPPSSRRTYPGLEGLSTAREAGWATPPMRRARTPSDRLLDLALLGGVVLLAALADVLAAAADQLVLTALSEQPVLALLATQGVLAALADQLVLAVTAADDVLAGTAADHVPVFETEDRVVAAVTEDHVRPGGPGDRVVCGRADECRDGGGQTGTGSRRELEAPAAGDGLNALRGRVRCEQLPGAVRGGAVEDR